MVENMQIETIERQLEKVGEVDAVLGIDGGRPLIWLNTLPGNVSSLW